MYWNRIKIVWSRFPRASSHAGQITQPRCDSGYSDSHLDWQFLQSEVAKHRLKDKWLEWHYHSLLPVPNDVIVTAVDCMPANIFEMLSNWGNALFYALTLPSGSGMMSEVGPLSFVMIMHGFLLLPSLLPPSSFTALRAYMYSVEHINWVRGCLPSRHL